MGHIPSKPTRYHKNFCRSRMEAGWAVFFDALWLKYRHEPKDTWLPSMQKRYLPDFRVSPCWGNLSVEVKGDKPTDFEQEKCEILCIQEGTPVLLINGYPWPDDYEAQLYFNDYDIYQCSWCGKLFSWNELLYCADCGNLKMFEPYKPSRFVNSSSVYFSEVNRGSMDDIYLSTIPITSLYTRPHESSLYFAFQLASRAKFEYLQNYTPRLYQGRCLLFNPAFQTQNWDNAELIYNTLHGFISLDSVRRLVDYGMLPMMIQEGFDFAIYAINENSFGDLCNRVFRDGIGFCRYQVREFVFGDRDIIDGWLRVFDCLSDILLKMSEGEPDYFFSPRIFAFIYAIGLTYECWYYSLSDKEDS